MKEIAAPGNNKYGYHVSPQMARKRSKATPQSRNQDTSHTPHLLNIKKLPQQLF
ncbi:MAG: hypothetical protein JXO49_02095 [Deltaproteobacteria bacterium]|nr:hypothetical protein [Candidatus Anaeroferrophillus wilburensis]MBN2888119.1 hypothetical protein [Deltaproteobacteria bacterium]